VSEPGSEAPAVLIVEDDEATAELERRVLARAGLRTTIARRVSQALSLLAEQPFSAVLLDYQLDGDPWQVLELARSRTPRVPVVIVTAMGNERVAAEAIQRGVAEYVKKANSFWDELPLVIDRVVRHAEIENRQRRSDALFQLIAQNASDILEISDQQGVVQYVSPACFNLLGYQPHEMVGRPRDEFLSPDHGQEEPSTRDQRRRRLSRWKHKSGDLVWLESEASESRGVDGAQPSEVISIHRDVTAQQRAERALRESEARFRTLFEDSPISLWEEDFSGVRRYLNELRASGVGDIPAYLRAHPQAVIEAAQRVRVVAVNQATLDLYRAQDERSFFMKLSETFGPDALSTFCDELCALAEGATHFAAETKTLTLEGTLNSISIRVNVIPGFEASWARVVVSIFDLTAHKEAERRLRDSLREKDVLLSEVHHRVKNNLQVVSSLLNLHASRLEDETQRRALLESQSRIQSIALVHETLYRSNDISSVDFGAYARTFLKSLGDLQGGTARGVSLDVRAEEVALSTDVAVTCGLIINELVTNAFKYAFPGERCGTITVEVKRRSASELDLMVADDGVGMPPEVDPFSTRSVGLRLAMALARQIDARVEFSRNPRTCFRLSLHSAQSSSDAPSLQAAV
jgi:PAS domain S-box-containing protein